MRDTLICCIVKACSQMHCSVCQATKPRPFNVQVRCDVVQWWGADVKLPTLSLLLGGDVLYFENDVDKSIMLFDCHCLFQNLFT